MVIVMKPEATAEQLQEVISKIEELGYKPHVIYGTTRSVIGAVGDERGKFVLQSLEVMDGVESVIPILKPYKLASKEVKKEKSIHPFSVSHGAVCPLVLRYRICLTSLSSLMSPKNTVSSWTILQIVEKLYLLL